MQDEVNKLIKTTLREREQDIIRLYYGLVDNEKCLTWEDISKRIGLSRERVRQVGLVSLEKLKHAARKKRLDAVLVKHWFLVYFTVDLLLSVYIKKGNLYLTFIFLMRNKYRYTNWSNYIEGLGPWVSVTIEFKGCLVWRSCMMDPYFYVLYDWRKMWVAFSFPVHSTILNCSKLTNFDKGWDQNRSLKFGFW